MNLKESFRYQNYLERLLLSACESIVRYDHCYKTTKFHLHSKSNPDAEDITEEVVADDFFANDDVIKLIQLILDEKEKLSLAITKAKSACDFDIDAAVAVNKSRQYVASSIKSMLRAKDNKSKERGTGYKFNVEGNQQPYYYDIEVIKTENFDREQAKGLLKTLNNQSDYTSGKVDETLINTTVDYTAIFDINDTFDDIMQSFINQ